MENTGAKDQDLCAADPNPIQRIAEILGVPVEAFFLPDIWDPKLQAFNDTAEFIQLFARIDDQQVRRRCIAFVRAAADGRGPSSTLESHQV